MEEQEIQLIEKWREKDKQLAKLYDEHKKMDKLISKIKKKPYLTPVEEREEKMLQQKKLIGKQKIMQMIKKYEGK